MSKAPDESVSSVSAADGAPGGRGTDARTSLPKTGGHGIHWGDNMDIIISHRSAMRFWRGFSGRLSDLGAVRRTTAMGKPVEMTPALREELSSRGFFPSEAHPIDLLFTSMAVRSRAGWANSHSTARPLPSNAFLRLTPHVLVTSPEVTFAQIAETYPFGQLVMAGCELCGTYRLMNPAGAPLPRPEERDALTSAARLMQTVRAMGFSATSAAARGARYVLDNAASPMEAKIALLLTLSTRLGGYGRPRPALNVSVNLSSAARTIYPHVACRPDLFWEDFRLDVEYDGEESHDGEAAHAKDVARAAALATDGINDITLTKQQVYSEDAFDAMARLVAQALGSPLRIRCADFPVKRAALRRELGLR